MSTAVEELQTIADILGRQLNDAEAREAKLREALTPFGPIADIYDHYSHNRPTNDDDTIMSWADNRVGERVLTVGDLRRARAALSPSTEPKT